MYTFSKNIALNYSGTVDPYPGEVAYNVSSTCIAGRDFYFRVGELIITVGTIWVVLH
jgi:hypothetical protein